MPQSTSNFDLWLLAMRRPDIVELIRQRQAEAAAKATEQKPEE